MIILLATVATKMRIVQGLLYAAMIWMAISL